jgi:hypothetical protein
LRPLGMASPNWLAKIELDLETRGHQRLFGLRENQDGDHSRAGAYASYLPSFFRTTKDLRLRFGSCWKYSRLDIQRAYLDIQCPETKVSSVMTAAFPYIKHILRIRIIS